MNLGRRLGKRSVDTDGQELVEYIPIMNNNLTVHLDVRMHQPCEGKDHRVACSIVPAISRVRREIDKLFAAE